MQVVLNQAIAGLGEPGDPVDVEDDYGTNIVEGGLASYADDVLPSESWTLPELRQYAGENGVDLTGATSKKQVLAAIEKHQGEQAPSEPAGE